MHAATRRTNDKRLRTSTRRLSPTWPIRSASLPELGASWTRRLLLLGGRFIRDHVGCGEFAGVAWSWWLRRFRFVRQGREQLKEQKVAEHGKHIWSAFWEAVSPVGSRHQSLTSAAETLNLSCFSPPLCSWF
jgi:hypothetical protein